MKNIAITCLVLVAVCVGLQAKKTVNAPYFMAASGSQLEIEKVTLGKDTTWVDAKIYSISGDDVRIDSTTILQVAGKRYAYLGGDGFSKQLWTRVPASGELPVTLKFEPLPMDAESFDFMEMPDSDDKGWCIYGVRLDGKKPDIGVPEKLLNQQLDYSQPLPDPELKNGKTVIRGRILGYNSRYGTVLNFNCTDWLFFDIFGQSIPIAEDGSFRYETNLLLPGEATLRVGKKRFELFLIPGGELVVTLNLPAIFWSETRLFGKKEKGQLVWFEGTYAGLNTELAKYGSLMNIYSAENFYENICGVTPNQYKKYVTKIYEKYRADILKNKSLSDAAHTYLITKLEMSYFFAINGYKGNISYAPMISGKKGVKRADMTVDESYYDEILKLDFTHSPYIRYGSYPDFVRVATENFKGKFEPESIWEDVLRAKPLGDALARVKPLSEEQLLTLDSIAEPEIKKALNIRNQKIVDLLAESAKKTGYTICQLDTLVTADNLIATITRPYRGKVVLIDMWNTWCGPCIRAMKSLQPVKEELKDVVYVYVADESSPEGKWKITIPDIHGIHYRITSEQSSAMGKLYEYPGIPTYFIVDREGNIAYKVTGFPGAEMIKEELSKL
ncbi:TlpA family protein disulfide reductase [Bacteroides oleiciplenus]|uniref:TlpA family protein disulfide reductase n=1 Tax=Bacteroides oleiciplenus TaxID=626931 RepID=UPI0026DD11F8|nr:TlpA disulfide reductase family protein [Bacteroides oleiciplenus]